MLAKLRLSSQQLRGRRFLEPSHPYRNDFQRDRDRIIHSRAFRRLEGKTQVFGAGLHDHFRNRLTHTIEVSQIARTVASALELNEEYTETLALAHDLGHPPFGHVGERELDRQMQVFGERFEHNSHALRIVDALERRYALFDGLNLTFEVREGIIKHSREVESGEVAYADLRPGIRPPLEAQLLDIADEIAYNVADIDDAFTARLFGVDAIAADVPVFAELTEVADTQYPGAPEHVRFWEVQRKVINLLVGGLVEGTVAAVEKHGVETSEDVRTAPERLAQLTAPAQAINASMRKLLIDRVYSFAQLVEDRGAAADKLRQLFEHLLQYPRQVSPYYRERLEIDPPHRVVCDYLAGMTDAYLMRKHRELMGVQ